jgi:hypothetical protein
MRTVAQKVFQVAYRTKNQGVEGWILVEADDFIEALDVFKSHFKDYEVAEIRKFRDIIKPLTKTITVEL